MVGGQAVDDLNGLQLLGSNKEMGAVLGISTQSVRNIGFRLRKKLGLLEAGSLEELAENI